MIKYICKYCGQKLGQVEHNELFKSRLGIEILTPEELDSIVIYEDNGDIIVKVVCEFCEEALDKNPELFLLTNPLQ